MELKQAIDYLAIRCDGAIIEDARGFNKLDAPLGHKLASLPEAEWSPRQRLAAWKMLAKYRGQLQAGGLDYDAIPKPSADLGDRPGKLITLTTQSDFLVKFAYDPTLVNAVKELPGRRFDSAGKQWIIPSRPEAVETLLKFAAKHDFDYADKVLARCHEVVEACAQKVEASRAHEADLNVDGLGGTLRPFQQAGVAYALQAKRTFIADEMGLGKTVEALATIQAANAYPALIVCPASLKLNWKREVEKWLPGHTVIVLNGSKANSDVDKAEIVVINYDILKKHLEVLQARQFKAVVFDESHFAKNHRAQRSQACKELAKGAEYRLALTGTPILNRPQELLSQLGILGRLDDLGGFWHFAKRYCNAHQNRFGWDFSGATHLDELNEKMRATCFIRRLKADVLQELPTKQRADVVVELDNRPEYNRAEANVIAWLRERATENREFQASIADLPEAEQKRLRDERANGAAERARRAEQLVRIETLKQVAARGKLAAIKEWTESFLESNKLVLFATHVEIQHELLAAFPEAARILGEDDTQTRQADVDRFQNDPECKLIICSLRAGGVGITLTAASNVAFAELGWTPAEHDQAEDRTHRIGQASQVTAWYLLAADTIDEQINELIARKRQVVDAATNGTAASASASILSELISQLTKGE